MRTIAYSELITENVSELEACLSKLTKGYSRDRCEVLLWLKSGRVKSMMECMRLKGLDKGTGVLWWRRYQQLGLQGYLSTDRKGTSSILNNFIPFWDKLGNEGFSTIKEAQNWLKEHHGITYTENGLGNYFRRHKIKCKTGRPFHPKQSEEERTEYKKNTQPN